MIRPARLLVAATVLALLGGCGTPSYVASGPWVPQIDAPPPQVGPPTDVPLPQAPAPGSPSPAPAPGADDPNVVASGLDTPWGLVILADGSALVGERRTGRILQVFPDRSAPAVLMTVPGLDASGDGGLLGLALSPTYLQDSLIYAYVTTPTDNRILRFSLGGVPQAIFTGIPKGPVDNGGRIAFGPDQLLYVGTGDTGDPALAGDPASLAGKLLRLDIFGKPARDNPAPGGAVFSSGHSNITGLCFDGADRLFLTESAQPAGDELNLSKPGADFGWPLGTAGVGAAETYPAGQDGLGGCSILAGTAFLGALTGEQIWSTIIDGQGQPIGDPQAFLTGTYGRLRTVVADGLGALWITTSNLDGADPPASGDDRVLRILPPAGSDGGVS